MGRQIWLKFLASETKKHPAYKTYTDLAALAVAPIDPPSMIMFCFLRKLQCVGENGLHRDLFPGGRHLGRREVHGAEWRARGTASLPCHDSAHERAGGYCKAPEFVERVERLEAYCGLDPGR